MRFVIIAATCLCLFLSCNKPATGVTDFEGTGVITGMDVSKCYCCWGWIININGKDYKFDRVPANSGFDLYTLTFPATVKVKWRDDTKGCSGKVIDILSIIKQ
jgi:hypothetical protein